MNATISAARLYIDQTWKGHDGWLSATQDPFRYSIGRGISIFASSYENEHLTWGILASTLKGLQDCLIANSWYQTAIFTIFDSNWGHVGDGSVMESVAGMLSGDE